MSDNEVRLIDANALIDDLKSLKYIGYCNDSFSILGNREIERCISAVKDAPTADDWEQYSTKLWKEAYEQGKADRPQGEWMFNSDNIIFGSPYGSYKCTNCNSWTGWITSFCPNCGAKMKGGETNDE